MENGNEKVVCLVEQLGDVNFCTDQLRETAVKNLEFYKVPSDFILVSTIPTIVNGKIDRAALPRS